MPANWTTPKDWVYDEDVDETDMNTHVRDNLMWLKSNPVIAETSTSTNFQLNQAGFTNVLVLSGVAIPADVEHCYVEAWAAQWRMTIANAGYNDSALRLYENSVGHLSHIQMSAYAVGTTGGPEGGGVYLRSPDYAWGGLTRTVSLQLYSGNCLTDVYAATNLATTPITLRIVRSH